jgi:hypothetical protein
MNTKKLPLGTQSFRKIRQEKYLYVDKTEYLYRIISSGSIHSRRFGKSLTIDTLESLLQVVILIDEYDVPILRTIGKSKEEMEDMQKTLHKIYNVMKGSDEYIKFIFLTGVLKFAGLSVFFGAKQSRRYYSFGKICAYMRYNAGGTGM